MVQAQFRHIFLLSWQDCGLKHTEFVCDPRDIGHVVTTNPSAGPERGVVVGSDVLESRSRVGRLRFEVRRIMEQRSGRVR